ncbi:hypothetical protein TWF481_002977 [Arthrobotrys musiformis]|uniref:Myb-like domain-containing protein n=1 Tax=Arthrobotrys musiformis TaxID=47236 RepID=A0AAV9VT32_9PEZI
MIKAQPSMEKRRWTKSEINLLQRLKGENNMEWDTIYIQFTAQFPDNSRTLDSLRSKYFRMLPKKEPSTYLCISRKPVYLVYEITSPVSFLWVIYEPIISTPIRIHRLNIVILLYPSFRMDSDAEYPGFVRFLRDIFLEQKVGRESASFSKRQILDVVQDMGMCIDVGSVVTKTNEKYKNLQAENIHRVIQCEIYSNLYDEAFEKLSFRQRLRQVGLRKYAVDVISFWSASRGFELSAVTLALLYLQTKIKKKREKYFSLDNYTPRALTTRYLDLDGDCLYLVGPMKQISVAIENCHLAPLGIPPPSWFSSTETMVYFHTHEFWARYYCRWLTNLHPRIKFGILAFELPRTISTWVGAREVSDKGGRQLRVKPGQDCVLIGCIRVGRSYGVLS